jgi:hypothetical protein
MRVEYQKSIILFSIILIFSALIGSSYFDRGEIRNNNTILFTILIFTCLIAYFQTRKIKQWKNDKKTDYSYVYWFYWYFTLGVIIYSCYVIVTRSEKQCFIKLNNLLVSKTRNLVGGFNGEEVEGPEMVDGIVTTGFTIYKNIWKKLLGIE